MLSLDAGLAGLAPSQGAEHVMLHLDDELAGLVEAADVPAGQDGTPSRQPDVVSLVPGEPSGVHKQVSCCILSTQLCASSVLCCAVLCCAVLCCAVPCCAVPCCAVPCRAVPCCAVLCRTVPCHAVLCHVVLCLCLSAAMCLLCNAFEAL